MFKTELHLHTAEVSQCSHSPTELTVQRYIEAGYTTVVVTNHLSPWTRRPDPVKTPTWDEKLDYFFEGVEIFREAAGGKLNVLAGVEFRFNDSDTNDYLVHGLGKDFWHRHPELPSLKVKDLSAIVREEGGLLYQAHPFRNNMTVTNPKLLDGIEIYNGHVGHDSRNDIAALWAKKFNLKTISGSDYHDATSCIDGGILTEEPITTTEQLAEILRSEKYELIRSNAVIY